MKPKVIVTQRLSENVMAYMSEHLDCVFWNDEMIMPYEILSDRIVDCDGAMVGGLIVDEALLSKASKLKAVSAISVGYNNLDIDAMKARGIIGTHTPEVLDDTVADLILALMLSTCRRIAELDGYIRQGKWVSQFGESLFGLDMHHKKLGIIGMGRIGEKIAKRCKYGFDMDVSYYNRSRKLETESELGIDFKPLDILLKESDFVVLMVPLTKDTVRMMNRDAFSKMKPTAIFINGSRGQTVVEEDLLEAIENGTIWGAATDVFIQEPIQKNHPFLNQSKIVMSPHIGSATAETREKMAITAAENIVAALSGKTPKYLIPEFKK